MGTLAMFHTDSSTQYTRAATCCIPVPYWTLMTSKQAVSLPLSHSWQFIPMLGIRQFRVYVNSLSGLCLLYNIFMYINGALIRV
jgi:hypothetical protein